MSLLTYKFKHQAHLEPYLLSIEERKEVREALKTDLDEETRSLYQEMLYIRATPSHTEKEKETINKFFSLMTKKHLEKIK